MSKFPLPADDRLENLIRESFEYTPGPDMCRLEQLENRLARTTRPRRPVNTLPWWIVLLLAGGFAAAAWWAGEKWIEISSEPLTVPSPAEPSLNEDRRGNTPNAESPSEGQATSPRRDTSVIYQRENF